MISLRQALMTGAATCAVVAMATPAFAEIQAFDIPAQSARTAIQEFGRQSGLQILASETDVGEQKVQGIKGEYEPREALRRLLVATNLRIASDDGRTVTLAPQSGSAAGDGADQGTVQALVVTAQKREENIQDVPIAMSAFTQEDLTKSQVTGGPDLMTQVPNFTFTKTNFSGYSIQIRGIGTQAISATTDAAVAVAENNTPFIRNRFFEQEFYDLERVEVLRGPQGTLYGRNATAGVVNIITAKPKFTYDAKLSADLGNYDSHRVEGMLNIPLVADKVALRIAGAWTKRDGYDTNQITGGRIDGRDLWSTRVSLRFEPTDNLHANLIWEHFNEDDDRLRSGKQLCKEDEVSHIGAYTVTRNTDWLNPGNDLTFSRPSATFSQGCAPSSLYSPDSFDTPNGLSLPYYLPLGAIFLPTALEDPYVSRTQSHDLRVIESTVAPHYTAKSDLAEFQIAFDLSNSLTLTSETGYNADKLFSLEDYNRFNTAPGAWDQPNPSGLSYREGVLTTGPYGGIFCDPQLGCSDRLIAVDLSTAKSRQFSQELRLSSNFQGPFNFSLGANFLRYDTEDKYYVFINSLSLISAISPYKGWDSPLSPYVAGVTDNTECLLDGLRAPDPTRGQPIVRCTYIDQNPIGSLNDAGHNYFLSRNPYKLISYAVFGEAYYTFTDDLKLTAGLRWTVDKKQAPLIPSWLLASDTYGYPVAGVINQEWREPTGRLALDWKPRLSFTDQTLLYASFAHGYKAGGANPPPYGVAIYHLGEEAQNIIQQSATHPRTFDPEFVNAFEIGTKNTAAGGRLTLNASAFYYNYTGYQISQIVDRSAVNMNFDARVWGLEFEGDWTPIENLRLGLKVGYENTRVANGEKAIDIMDRTAGDPNWVVVRPFPSIPSNCILPVSIFARSNGIYKVGNAGGGGDGPCEVAYISNFDPVTEQPYNPNTYITNQGFSVSDPYRGFNPETAPNHGEGIAKDLSGHELPNAPHFTTTLTGDYTVPLPSDWLMTLHTDLYYQSEAWTRIFNTPGYDKLKAYTNVNLAAIFTNEDAGWKVMAYVKNVFDRDSITGAFLNSDDTGLTTNVFLTEPRLYGLRVTKEWTGDSWWTGANPNHPAGEPYPLTIELGGTVQRQDAPYEALTPSFIGQFSPALQPQGLFNRDLDTGDEREVKITYRPAGSPWNVSGSMRYGRTNGGQARTHAEELGNSTGCFFGGAYAYYCAVYAAMYANDPAALSSLYHTGTNYSDAKVKSAEEHTIVGFEVGRDVGLGGLRHSSIGLELRYAQLKSSTDAWMKGVPDWEIRDGWGSLFGLPPKYEPRMHTYEQSVSEGRELKATGPVLNWDASLPLLGSDEIGHLDLDWSLSGGVLFGKQKTSISGFESVGYFLGNLYENPRILDPISVTPIDVHRSKSVIVPVADLALGVSYEIQRIKLSTGYRWERYFNAIDAGNVERKSYDRTFDGPYFKIAVGFGG